MKMVDKKTQSTTNDTNSKFTITASSRAFQILSDGLYSDKIVAVIRELSCNAYDSHVSANKANVPFDVGLPTINNPTFYVQDYGIGISDADIYNIYICYFTSTKSNDDSLVGQLGLGSKSPFSMVREFFVESNFNNEYRKYRMYFDSSDTPRVQFVDHQPTKDQNGVKVSFTVKSNDIDRFSLKAKEVLKWFKTTPNIIIGNNDFTIPNNTTLLKYSGWYMEPYVEYSSNRAYALMGNVIYPIDARSLKNTTEYQYHLLRLPIIIQFKIGDLEVAANRESISYDARSNANILARLDQVINEYYIEISNKIFNAKTEWDAHIAYNVAFNNGTTGFGLTLLNTLKNRKFTWNGIKINSNFITVNLNDFYPTIKGANTVRTVILPEINLHRVKRDDFSDFNQYCSKHNFIVFDDLPRNGAARIKVWLATLNKTSKITIFEKPTNGYGWEGLIKKLGNPEIVWASNLPATHAKERAARQEKMMSFVRQAGYKKTPWKTCDHKSTDGGFYVNYQGRNVIDAGGKQINLDYILNHAAALGYISNNVEVFAARGYLRKKILKLTNWVNIVDFIGEKVNENIEHINVSVDTIATKQAFEQVSSKINCKNLNNFSWTLRYDNSDMHQLLNVVSGLQRLMECNDKNKTNSTFIALAKVYNVPIRTGVADPKVNWLLKKINERYPMLLILDRDAWQYNFKMINDYVNMIDCTWMYFELSKSSESEEN